MTVVRSPTIQFEFAESYENCDSKDAGKSQRHHEYCCERVSFTYLDASYAIRGHPQSAGSDVPSCRPIIRPVCMAYDPIVEDTRVGDFDLFPVQHSQPYLARFLLRHHLGGCHFFDSPIGARGQDTHRHRGHEYTSGISSSEGFHSRPPFGLQMQAYSGGVKEVSAGK